MSNDDAEAVFRELKSVQTRLDTVVEQTAPDRRLHDLDLEDYVKGIIEKLPDKKVSAMKRLVNKQILQQQRPTTKMLLQELKSVRAKLDKVIKWTA